MTRIPSLPRGKIDQRASTADKEHREWMKKKEEKKKKKKEVNTER